MATTLQMPPEHLPDGPLGLVSPQPASDYYARRIPLAELDLRDSRYPILPKTAPPSTMSSAYAGPLEDLSQPAVNRKIWVDYSPGNNTLASANWLTDRPNEGSFGQSPIQQPHSADARGSLAYSPKTLSQLPQATSTNVSPGGLEAPLGCLPHGPDDKRMSPTLAGIPAVEPRASIDTLGGPSQLRGDSIGQQFSSFEQYRARPPSLVPSAPRHPSLPMAGIGNPAPSAPVLAPIVPLSAGPSYSPASMAIPISSSPRAYPQQPTFINPSATTPAFVPPQIPKEEVCVECAMRDQDMADVDVTSPGAWDRESDVLYEELCRRDAEEDPAAVSSSDHSSRPRARGDMLTEGNLKLWMSVNPKEPSNRLQTLDQYVRAQRALLEIEAAAHARAIRESRQLDDRMRDAYTQLRRSAYELGSSPALTDDSSGVRIKIPHLPSVPSSLAQGRDITLLENGMIVEHVDVRREEREERERRRKEEKRERSRARKTSRSSRSGADVMSVYSMQTPPLPTDSGFFSGPRSDSRFSQSMSARPSSVLTGGNERPLTMLGAQSQASFSDMQSVGSTSSPRRSTFFGLRNLSAGWRSRDSLAPSGSMIDMHVALQREQQLGSYRETLNAGSNAPTLRIVEPWTQSDSPRDQDAGTTKKATGLKKIWKIVTGTSSKSVAHATQSRSTEKPDDDAPLAPPPPLSYLVSRDGSPRGRHVSTPSLPSTASPNTFSPYTPSPPTAPSSLVPSPTSSRPSGVGEGGLAPDLPSKTNGGPPAEQDERNPVVETHLPESDSRTRSSSRTLSSANGPLTPATTASQRPMSCMLSREKTLPPLPPESSIEFPNHTLPDARPQTVFTYDPNGLGPGYAPQPSFRDTEVRRQSFSGLDSQPVHRSPVAATVGPNVPVAVPPFFTDEFGVTRSSSGQWTPAQYSQPSLPYPTSDKPKKRKSKFGFGSLFGRKSVHGHVSGNDGLLVTETLEFPAYRTSYSEVPYDGMMVMNAVPNGYGPPAPIFSGSANPRVPRLSVGSRRNLDLVDQDPEFVAYRYPSTDQRMDLAR